MRAEAVRGVPEEVQKQLEKLKVGHVLCQLPPHLIADLLPYSGKFLRVLIFAVFMDQLRSAKIKTSKFSSWFYAVAAHANRTLVARQFHRQLE